MGNYPNSVSRIIRLKPFMDTGFVDPRKYMKTLSLCSGRNMKKEMTLYGGYKLLVRKLIKLVRKFRKLIRKWGMYVYACTITLTKKNDLLCTTKN